MVDGYYKSIRNEWERALWITYSSMRGNVNIPEHSRAVTFKDYVAEVLDGVDHHVQVTPEQLDEIQKLWGLK